MAYFRRDIWNFVREGGLFLALLGVSAQISGAAVLPDCEVIAAKVETATGLPAGILASISRVESGTVWADGKLKGWPWATNNRGKGKYFKKREHALKYIKKVIDSGDRNIDVGCMQINYRWHGKAFESIEQMIDPAYNVPYAARFLKVLYERHGDWEKAIRYYHSGNSKYNRSYLARVKKVWPDIQTQLLAAAPPQYSKSKAQAPTRRAAELGFEDLPVLSVVTQDWKQGISLWANAVPEMMSQPKNPASDETATAESSSTEKSTFSTSASSGVGVSVVTDNMATEVADTAPETLNFFAPKVTKVASIDELPPMLSRRYDKIKQFREMLKKSAGL